MTHITIIGKTGQLARALIHEAELSGVKINSLDRTACDLSGSTPKIEAVIDSLPATDAIIIAAAYTAVDDAETERSTALAVNAHAPGTIGRAAKKRNIPVVHISTDYVFAGDSCAPYRPEEDLNPVNFYGLSKAKGENALMLAQPRSTILRTSWVYDTTGKNFLTTMLRLAQTRTELSVVYDQIGRPTFAGDLAKASLKAAKALIGNQEDAKGVFHVSNTGDPISWADFATEIFVISEGNIGHKVTISSIPSADYPTPAKRPAWSVLDVSKFEDVFDFQLPHWRDALKRAILEGKMEI